MSNKLSIYKHEKEDGLYEILAGANANRITLASILTPGDKKSETIDFSPLLETSEASLHDVDLYRIDTILASAGWNKNDDVFSTAELWNARHTPEDKPINIEHKQSHIIGHITNNRCYNVDLELISDVTVIDDLPEKLHIVTAGVLYKSWRDEELQTQMDTMIAEIEKREWCVSMECMFSGFDYAIIPLENGKPAYSVARNEKTSFLTKYLKAYGGRGVYQEQRIGRLFKNIVFYGKGMTKTPANPESIILYSSASTFNSKSEIHDMAESTKTENVELTLVKEYKEQNVELTKTNAALASQITEAKNQIAEFTTKLAGATSELTTVKTTVDSTKGLYDEAKASLEALQKKYDELETAKAALETEVNKMKAEKVAEARLLQLIEAGMKREDAVAKVAKFATASDELFAEFVTLAKLTQKTEEIVEKKTETSTSSVLDTLEEDGSGVNYGVASELSEEVRNKIRENFTAFLAPTSGKKE